uniref:Uncharacterized protein n=1 Tax=Panagrolaimus sp. ES5 TaxID=591445 RepID=A0AC34FB74_9BILA
MQVKIFWLLIVLQLFIQDLLILAAPIPQYSQNGYMRDLSNQLDQRYNGGMNRNPYYEGYIRPITHSLWHGGAGIAQTIDNGRKYMGSYLTGKNPNYHNPSNEFNRARIQYGRIGEGRPGFQRNFDNNQRYMNNPYNNNNNNNNGNNPAYRNFQHGQYNGNNPFNNNNNGNIPYNNQNNPNYRNPQQSPYNNGMNSNYRNPQNGYNPAGNQYGYNPNQNQYGRVNDRYPGYQRNSPY